MRHLDHLDLFCEDDAEHCANSKADIHCPNVANAVVDDGEYDCNQHADCTDAVADFAILNFAHESNSAKDAKRKDDCKSKICPLCVCAHKAHATDCCNKTCGKDKGDCIDDFLSLCLVFCDHAKHTVCDHKATNHVDHCKGNGNHAKESRHCNSTGSANPKDEGSSSECAKDGDAREGVHA